MKTFLRDSIHQQVCILPPKVFGVYLVLVLNVGNNTKNILSVGMLPHCRCRQVLIHSAAIVEESLISLDVVAGEHLNMFVFLLFCIRKCLNVDSYTSQLSISKSRRSAEAVFGLSQSALPASGDPVLQNSSRQGDQRGEQSTLVTRGQVVQMQYHSYSNVVSYKSVVTVVTKDQCSGHSRYNDYQGVVSQNSVVNVVTKDQGSRTQYLPATNVLNAVVTVVTRKQFSKTQWLPQLSRTSVLDRVVTMITREQ